MVGKIEFSGKGYLLFPKNAEEPKQGDHVKVVVDVEVGEAMKKFSDTLAETVNKWQTDVLKAVMAATGDSVAPSARARIADIKERYFGEEQAVDQMVYSALAEKERTRGILTEALARHGAKCSYGKFTDSFFAGGVLKTKYPSYQEVVDRLEEQIKSAFALPKEFLAALDLNRPTLITGENFIKKIYPSGYVRRKADSKLGFIKAGEPIKVKGIKFIGGRAHLYLEGYGCGKTTFNAKSFEDAGAAAFISETLKQSKEGKIDPKSLYPSGYVRVAPGFSALHGLPPRLASRVTEAKYEDGKLLIKLEGCDSGWPDGFWGSYLFVDAGPLAPKEKPCEFKVGDQVRVKKGQKTWCLEYDRTYTVESVKAAEKGGLVHLKGLGGGWYADRFFKVTEKPDWAMSAEEYRATHYSEMRQRAVEQSENALRLAGEIAMLTKRIKNYEEIGHKKAVEVAKLNEEVIRLKRRVNWFLDNTLTYYPYLEADRVAREIL